MNLNKMIDHTLLKPEATEGDVAKLCAEAVEYGFASICINPCFVPIAKQLLGDSDIKVCTVVGFPLGACRPEIKAYEAEVAVQEGAKEVDMVINIGLAKDKKYDELESEIRRVTETVKAIDPEVIVKVIIETCLLTDEEKVLVCERALATGADFVKTSTGFSTGGAKSEDVALMKKTVSNQMRVKASGGVRSYADAMKMIHAGAERIGTSNGISIVNG